MALLHRRKAFSVISRYRLCGRLPFSSSASEPGIPGLASLSSYTTQMQSLRRLLPAMAVAMPSPLSMSPPVVAPRSYTTVAACPGVKHTTACCHTHKCTVECGCLCSSTGALHISARDCTTTAYPPPAPPGDFQGGDEEADADGAALNVDEAEGAAPMEGADDFNMPPYDDSKYAEDDDDGAYQDEDPPPDPEEKLLYSPSDED